MKKILSLTLCLVTVLSLLAGCRSVDKSDKGATIPIYLTSEVSNFDPAYGNLDDATMQIMSMLYEGLFKYDSNGKVVKAQAKSVKKLDKPSKNYYAIEITLKNTSWSDGTPVMASDYIYAWKRILESDFRGEAANMLFCIKNARAVHDGDATIDDLGITDVAKNVIRIEFEGETDYDLFYEYLASPMLVPLREFQVGRIEADWSSNASIMVSNGPFMIRSYVPGVSMLLERNNYYMRNEDDAYTKSVTPFRLEINFGVSAKKAYEALQNGEIVYTGDIDIDMRKELLDSGKLTVTDTMSVMSVLFNVRNELLSDGDVRRALSLALDRNKIVELITFAKPAQGLIADGVFNTTNGKGKDSFREKSGKLIDENANLTEAKNLLKGKETGTINLVARDTDADLEVAKYIKKVWEGLGFTVNIEKRGFEKYSDANDLSLVADEFAQAYENKEFDVILVDYMMFSTDAFSNLATFAKGFAGGAMNMDVADGNYELETHISGYYNAEYDALIEKAYKETDAKKRAEILHEAEALLMEDMPIAPLVQLQNAYSKNADLKGVTISHYGTFVFTKATLKNRDKYEDSSNS